MEKHKPDEGHEPGLELGYFRIDIRPDNIIFVEPTGYITGAVVERELERLKQTIAVVQNEGHKVLILVNIGRITKHTSDSRTAIKEASELPFERGAAYGGSLALGLIMQYLQRSIDPNRAHYFRGEQAALSYLKGKRGNKRPNFGVASRRSIILSAVLFMFFTTVTYLGWTYSNQQLASESKALFGQKAQRSQAELQRRMDVYVQALYGVRGLFNANASIERDEFDAYFKSLNLSSEFPGFNAISFVKHVSNSDLAKFTASVRGDKSLNGVGYPTFTVYPSASKPTYDVVTYVEPLSAATNLGHDLSSDPVRLQTFNQARDSGLPVASATVTFLSAPQSKGFLVTMPLYSKPQPTTSAQRQHQLIGYVNAVFRYNTLFSDAFADIKEPSIAIEVKDGQGQTIYADGTTPLQGQTQKSVLKIGGQNLEVYFRAPSLYGLSQTSLRLPRNVVGSGSVALILLALLLVALVRTRSQAIKLAKTMTADLENERNVAIDNQRKLEISEKALAEEKASVERKVVERTRELNEAHAQLEASLRGLPFGFVIINRQLESAFSNPALEKILGLTPAANGRPSLSQLSAALAGSVDIADCLQQAEATARIIRKQCMLGNKYLNILCVPIEQSGADSARFAGFVIILEDITEEKALQRSRDEFFSIASHELRTPLTVMYGNATMILDTYQEKLDDPALKQMVSDIASSSKRLIDIVKDFLNVSELEQGRARIAKADVDLGLLVSQAVNEYKPEAERHELYVKFDRPDELIMSQTDATRVRQILDNLITNSLRFTKRCRQWCRKPKQSVLTCKSCIVFVNIPPMGSAISDAASRPTAAKCFYGAMVRRQRSFLARYPTFSRKIPMVTWPFGGFVGDTENCHPT